MDLLQDEDLVPTGTTRQGRPEFRLTRELTFEAQRVPKGYVTDKYSLPGRLIPFIWQPHHAKYAAPAILHDWAYETMSFGADEGGRELADAMLMRAMTAAGISPWRRWIVWAAVRVGGRRGYGVVDPDNIGLARKVRPDLEAVLA